MQTVLAKRGKMKAGEGVREPWLKRSFDFVVSVLGFLLFLPVWTLISLAIFVDDGGPLFFSQGRAGRGERAFRVLKFRTMKDQDGPAYVDVDLEEDPRVTRVGKILRAMAMDELPELINILKGEMSFVGPRALPFVIEDEERWRYKTLAEVPGYGLRSRVRPGLTGLAQIYAPKDASRRCKFRYDNLYIRNMSFFFDLKLMFISLWTTVRGKWEYRGKKTARGDS